MNQWLPLKPDQMDLLRELSNIGVGHATTALSVMLGDQRITMEVPSVSIVSLHDVPEQLGGEDRPVAGVYFESEGDFHLTMLFVLNQPSVETVTGILLPGLEYSVEMKHSVLMELGNIITAAYLNALCMMTDLTLLPTPPRLAIDMAGAILGTVIGEASIDDEEIIMLKTNITAAEAYIEGCVLIIPDSGALQTIFTRLGIS